MQRTSEDIDDLARDWVVRLGTEGGVPEDRLVCESWRRSDTRHDLAYRRAERLWRNLSEWKELADLEPLERPAFGVRVRGALGRFLPEISPRVAFAGAAVAAAMATAVIFVDRVPQSVSTKTAQIRTVTLPDGSLVTLGARSAMELAFSPNERRVKLTGGDAFFSVAKDASKPFLVEAGTTAVRVLGTQFDVHRDAEQVRIAVLEGEVEVTHRTTVSPDIAKSPVRRILKAGQEAVSQSSAQGESLQVRAVGFDRPGAWRKGRLIYVDASLGEIVADANRYFEGRIEIEAPQLREMRLTTSFRTDEIERMIDTLERTLPVTVDRGREGVVMLRSKDSK